MLKKNDRVNLRIERLGSNAEGIARINDFVVFVPFALPGETVDALIVSVKRNYAFAKLMGVLIASPDRIDPLCPYYGRCGGCTCQHMRYEASLTFKRDVVEDCFKKIAKCDVPIADTVGMEHPWRYRNKTAAPIQASGDTPVSGFFAPRSHRLIPIDDCPIAAEQSGLINKAVLEWMQQNNVSAYCEQTHTGIVRHIVSRTNRAGESMVLLVINAKELPHADALISSLHSCGASVTTAAYSVNTKQNNTILGSSFHVLYGNGYITESLLDLKFRISPLSFFQVNSIQAEKLYAKAIELCALDGHETVADLYCGTGTIGLCFAKRARRVVGVEIEPTAIVDAKENSRLNGIKNAEFLCGKSEELLPAMLQDGFQPDVVVLDPPRKGAAPELLEAIAACNVPKIVYISCHPATQARDAEILVHQAGYRIAACQPVDMFCQTSGIENILLFEKAVTPS